MKIFTNCVRLRDDNLFFAHMRVQRFADRMGIGPFLDVDMRDLAERMYAGVGAPRSVHAGLFSAEPEYGLLFIAVDGPLSWRWPA